MTQWGVNLIPADIRQRQAVRRRAHRWGAAAAAYAAALAIACLALHLLWEPSHAAAARQLQQTKERTQQADLTVDELRHRLIELQGALAANRSLSAQPDWPLLLVLLAEQLGEHAVLSSARIRPGDNVGNTPGPDETYTLELSGLAASQAEVSALLLRLEEAALFDSVTLVNTRKEPFINDARAVGFEIRCRFSI